MTRKLKWWVMPTMYLMSIVLILSCFYLIGSILSKGISSNVGKMVVSGLKDTTIPVIDEVQDGVVRPYNLESVQISKYFYDPESDSETQEKALLFYQNIYMQNTGVLYSSSEKFDIIAVMDGVVKDVKDDDLLGKVIEIEHNNKLTTFYRSLTDVHVIKGDKVSQGDIIGTSGSNNLDTTQENNLLFEVYLNGKNINPELFFEMSIEELS